MNPVYVVVDIDQHRDPIITVFARHEAAMRYAAALAENWTQVGAPKGDSPWLWWAAPHENSEDMVFVVESEVQT